jgi:hypothetical protein
MERVVWSQIDRVSLDHCSSPAEDARCRKCGELDRNDGTWDSTGNEERSRRQPRLTEEEKRYRPGYLFQGIGATQMRKGNRRPRLNGREREERAPRKRTTSRGYGRVEERESEEGNKPSLKRKGEKPTSKTEWAGKRRKSAAKADNLPRV